LMAACHTTCSADLDECATLKPHCCCSYQHAIPVSLGYSARDNFLTVCAVP
jgi:hypothetical protein